MDFKALDLPEPVVRGIQDAGFVAMTPIQEGTLPLALKGKDVAGQSQTGTGKTATPEMAAEEEAGEPEILLLAAGKIRSGTFTVGLLRALHAYKREPVTPGDLAEEACHIEIDLLDRPAGKQDQYIASFGGITCFQIEQDGRVHVSPLSINTATLHDLEEHLLMFFTGYSRRAEELLDDQRQRTEAEDEDMIDALRAVEEVGVQIRTALENGDTGAFGGLMHEHWVRKRERSKGMTRPEIDEAYDAALANGALGGKLARELEDAGVRGRGLRRRPFR